MEVLRMSEPLQAPLLIEAAQALVQTVRIEAQAVQEPINRIEVLLRAIVTTEVVGRVQEVQAEAIGAQEAQAAVTEALEAVVLAEALEVLAVHHHDHPEAVQEVAAEAVDVNKIYQNHELF